MKILVSEVLTNLDGSPIVLNDRPLSLGRALGVMLVAAGKSSDPLRSYLLAKKLQLEAEGSEVELDASEVAFIKEAIPQSTQYTTLVVGQVLEKLAA